MIIVWIIWKRTGKLPRYHQIFGWVLDFKKIHDQHKTPFTLGYIKTYPATPTQLPVAIFNHAYPEGDVPVLKEISPLDGFAALADHIPLRSNSALLTREKHMMETGGLEGDAPLTMRNLQMLLERERERDASDANPGLHVCERPQSARTRGSPALTDIRRSRTTSQGTPSVQSSPRDSPADSPADSPHMDPAQEHAHQRQSVEAPRMDSASGALSQNRSGALADAALAFRPGQPRVSAHDALQLKGKEEPPETRVSAEESERKSFAALQSAKATRKGLRKRPAACGADAGEDDGGDSDEDSDEDEDAGELAAPKAVAKPPKKVPRDILKSPAMSPGGVKAAAKAIVLKRPSMPAGKFSFAVTLTPAEMKATQKMNFVSKMFHRASSAAKSKGYDHDEALAIGRKAYEEAGEKWDAMSKKPKM